MSNKKVKTACDKKRKKGRTPIPLAFPAGRDAKFHHPVNSASDHSQNLLALVRHHVI